jgi:hypothetical protein
VSYLSFSISRDKGQTLKKIQFLAASPALWLLISAGAHASQWSCESPRWVGDPSMQNDRFVGTLVAGCVLQLDHEADLAGLSRHLLESVKSARTVNEGPVSETYHGLPGVRYDVTVYYPADKMTMRQNLHVATDQTGLLVYETDSTSVQAPGFAGYLRSLNVEFEISKGAVTGTAQFNMKTSIEVARPWFAPSGIFFSEAQKNAINQFDKSREDALPDLYGHL